jgi:hypothetical protein
MPFSGGVVPIGVFSSNPLFSIIVLIGQCYHPSMTNSFLSPSVQGVPGVKVITSGFNSRADAELKTSYTHGSKSQQFRSYEFLKYSK